MRSFIFIILGIGLLCSFTTEKDTLLLQAEKKLANRLNDIRKTGKTDAEKDSLNQLFKKELQNTFKLKGMFDYPFDQLNSLGKISSSDGVVRIFSWNIEKEDFSQLYYCYVVYRSPRNQEISVTELQKSPNIHLVNRPNGIIDADEWYGALYYKIIPQEKNGKTYYTLLGWDGNSTSSTIKVIDVLYFSGTKPRLGYNLFKTDDGTQKRIFFEYKEQAVMSLQYEADRNRIVFDHLSPETPSLKGFYAYYVPDLSYDAFEFKNNYWQYKADVITINKADNKKITVYTMNKKTGEAEQRELKKEWINPTDENTAGNKHVANLPEDEDKGEKPKVKTNREKNPWKKGKERPGSILQNSKQTPVYTP
jgi:hypothetical protein